jgi:hypothetical protein
MRMGRGWWISWRGSQGSHRLPPICYHKALIYRPGQARYTTSTLCVFQENLQKDVVRITDRRASESSKKLLGNDMQHLVIRPELPESRFCTLASLWIAASGYFTQMKAQEREELNALLIR